MKPSAIAYYATSSVQILRNIRPLPRVFGLLRKPRATSVHIPRLNLHFAVRDFMDVWCLKETFLNRDYIEHGYRGEAEWTVIDVGAALGDFSIQMKRDFGVRRVVAVEPAPSAIALLRANLDGNGSADVEIVGKALSDRAGELWLDTSGAPLSMGTSGTQEREDQVRVEAITLTTLYDELGIDRCDLIKMDCEGAEFTLLREGANDVLDRTDRVVLEFHEAAVTDGRDRHTLVDILRKAGFSVETFENRVHRNLGFIRAIRPAAAGV